jgi:hypothetical protein
LRLEVAAELLENGLEPLESKTWNGQEAEFRMFTVAGIVLLLLVESEAEQRLSS